MSGRPADKVVGAALRIGISWRRGRAPRPATWRWWILRGRRRR